MILLCTNAKRLSINFNLCSLHSKWLKVATAYRFVFCLIWWTSWLSWFESQWYDSSQLYQLKWIHEWISCFHKFQVLPALASLFLLLLLSLGNLVLLSFSITKHHKVDFHQWNAFSFQLMHSRHPYQYELLIFWNCLFLLLLFSQPLFIHFQLGVALHFKNYSPCRSHRFLQIRSPGCRPQYSFR